MTASARTSTDRADVRHPAGGVRHGRAHPLRKGITALETLGLTPTLIVMNPANWERIELLREGGATGGYLLGLAGPASAGPREAAGVGRPGGALHQRPTGAAAPAYILSEGSATLFHDGVVEVKWGVMNDDFGKNQVRARAEGRFQMGVTRPAGVVKATISA